jgi:hypothetical protein
MTKSTFCYEQQRLENDLVTLEPFDVRIFNLTKNDTINFYKNT